MDAIAEGAAKLRPGAVLCTITKPLPLGGCLAGKATLVQEQKMRMSWGQTSVFMYLRVDQGEAEGGAAVAEGQQPRASDIRDS